MPFLIVLVIVGVAAVAVWARFWELRGCPRCKGSGRGWGSQQGAFNRRCSRCGGNGTLIRPLSLIWPQHRAEARQRRKARKK